MSSGAIWIARIYILALRALNVKIVAMNIDWHFHASVAIFVHHAIRNGWWNSANGCVKLAPQRIQRLLWQSHMATQ
jgi:hypothetical protein